MCTLRPLLPPSLWLTVHLPAPPQVNEAGKANFLRGFGTVGGYTRVTEDTQERGSPELLWGRAKDGRGVFKTRGEILGRLMAVFPTVTHFLFKLKQYFSVTSYTFFQGSNC